MEMKGGEMETIDVSMHFRVPIEKVWGLFADYEGYTFAEEVNSSKLLQEGQDEKNGLGAIREVQVKGVTFVEEIVTFNPPSCLEYLIKECTIPVKHEIGRMDFYSTDDGTYLHWISKFEFPSDRSQEPAMCQAMSEAFQSILRQAKARLET
jgi:hypothetical protein